MSTLVGESRVPEGLCTELFIVMGSEHARKMGDLLTRLIGSACQCAAGGECLFRPAA
jgi:hypothetical protein